MKKFWLGVLAGASGTILLCAGLFFATNLYLIPRATAGFGLVERSGLPPIVLRGLFGSRGEYGVIDEISGQSVRLLTRGGDKRTITILAETVIYRGRSRIVFTDLSKGQRLVVIGEAQSDGSIRAKLIRAVSPSPQPSGLPTDGY